MVDQFDPTQLRHDLLRRMVAVEAPQMPEEPGVLAKCAGEIRRWFSETPLVMQCRRLRFRGRGHHFASDCSVDTTSRNIDSSMATTEAVPPARSSMTSQTEVESSQTDDCLLAVDPPSATGDAAPFVSRGPPLAASRTSSSVAVARAAIGAAEAAVAATAPQHESVSKGFPAKAIYGHICAALQHMAKDIQVLLFLAFPIDSPYHDSNVEGLFQWHYTRRWWLCFDWSSVALLLMLLWDVLMNPPYRLTLVLLFYATFGAGILLRKILLFAAPSPPRSRRVWHNVLLCTFFFGRCVVCQPLLADIANEGSKPFRTLHVEAFSSVVGLGMTNLSMVFMQQMQTLDMLLFCLANGLVFVLWILFVLQMPLTDALHTAYVGSIVVTAVCVRQQRDLEDIERRTFEHELLHARSLLLRSADRISTQASPQEFAIGMHMLSRLRRVEHLHF